MSSTKPPGFPTVAVLKEALRLLTMGHEQVKASSSGRLNRLALRLRAWLVRPNLAVRLAILAAVLTLPSLGGGRVIDDRHQQLRFADPATVPESVADLAGSPMKSFVFATGDREHTHRLMDLGVWPWWTLPDIHAAFFRPIAIATHWLDYKLWPDRPVLMHAHSVLWFAVLAYVVTGMYRRFLGLTWVAGLAAFFYVMDDARGMPVGFLANRNALVAAVFGVGAIISHDRWRREGWKAGAVLAPLLLATSLCSAEAGIGTIAYLFAHSVFLDRSGWRRRVTVLLPYAAVVLVWRIVWTRLGCGIWGMDFYVDPLTEPWRFFVAMLERIPTLLLGQLFLPPAELYFLGLDFGLRYVHLALVMIILVPLAILMVRRLIWDSLTAFWTLGMMLSAVPICATFPADRMLFFVGLGGFALIARFLELALAKPAETSASGVRSSLGMPTRIVAVAMVVIHAVLAPVGLAVRSAVPVGPPSILERFQVSVDMEFDNDEQSLVVVTAPVPILAGYFPERRALAGLPIPPHTRILSPCGFGDVVVSRPDANTLVVRPAGGFLAFSFDRLARGSQHPMFVGQQVHLTGMTAEVLEVTPGGRPSEVAFEFAVPLEDSSLRWLYWKHGQYDRFVPPPIGTSKTLPGPRTGIFARISALRE